MCLTTKAPPELPQSNFVFPQPDDAGAPAPSDGNAPPLKDPDGSPTVTIAIVIITPSSGNAPQSALVIQPGESDLAPVDPDLQPANAATDKLNKKNAYLDPKTNAVYEKNGATGKFLQVGYVGQDGKFHRYGDDQILEQNFGARAMEQKDAPKGYKYDKTKEPKIDKDGNIWEKDAAGQYRNVGYKDKKGEFHKYSEAQTIKQSFGGVPMNADNQPEGYQYDPKKYPMVDDNKNVWEWNKDTGKYEKVGSVGDDNKFKPDTMEDILNNNYGPTRDIDPNNVPKGYKNDPEKHPKIDNNGNVWEWDAPRGKYKKVGYVDKNNNFHAPVTVRQPDPATLKQAVPANYDNGGQIPDEAYIDPDNDVYVYKNDKYIRVGHVDGNNTYHHYSADDIMRENYGAEDMDPNAVPQGYSYDPDKHPKIDDDGKIWEWSPEKQDYVNVGYIGQDQQFHKGQPPKDEP